MIEKVKADKILGTISPFLKLYHLNMDRPAEEILILFYLFKNFVYKDLKVLSIKRKIFKFYCLKKSLYETQLGRAMGR